MIYHVHITTGKESQWSEYESIAPISSSFTMYVVCVRMESPLFVWQKIVNFTFYYLLITFTRFKLKFFSLIIKCSNNYTHKIVNV